MLMALVGNALSANAQSRRAQPAVLAGSSDLGAVLAPMQSASGQPRPNFDAGYYQNIVGPLTVSAIVNVPSVNCRNKATWGTKVEMLAVTSSLNGSTRDEIGGGIDVGCSAANASPAGAPVYSGALCTPDAAACGVLADPVSPGDSVAVTVAAAGGCAPVCSSVTVTVNDTTQGWTENWTGSTPQSDFDTYVIAVGFPALAKFAKVSFSHVSVNGSGWSAAQRYELIDQGGKTLAKASKMGAGKTSFSVKWVRYQ
jgi:hypothetical protein